MSIGVYTGVSMTVNQNLTLLSITDLHRNVGKVFDELLQVGGYTVIRDSKAIAVILPIKPKVKEMTKEELIAKVKALAGGFRLKRDLSPGQMNREYDKIYDKMLPRLRKVFKAKVLKKAS